MSVQQDFEIQSIRNLEMIYFYDISKSDIGGSSTPFLGLKIVYDNGKGLGYDVTSENFNKFVQKVKDVYNQEKENGKIDFLNEYSRKLMEELDVTTLDQNLNVNYEKESLIETKSRYSEIMEIKDYIKYICKNLLSFILKDKKIDIVDIKGYNNKFSVTYTVDELIKQTLSMIIKKVSSNKYTFKIDYVSDCLFSIEGNINFEDSYVNIEWRNKQLDLYSTCKYNIDTFLSENVLRKNEKMIDFKEVKTNVDVQEQILLNFYTKQILGEEMDTFVPTVENNYLLSQVKFIDNSGSKDHLYNKILGHATINSNFVRLKCHISNGVSKNDDKLKFSFNEKYHESLVKAFNIDNTDYVVVETMEKPIYQDSSILDYESKRYYYNILEVEEFKNFNTPFKIKNKIDGNSDENKKLLLRLIK